MTDNVNHPSHYSRFRFTCEPKDFTKHLPHPLASAVEYIIRAPHKGNELEDLEKACFWLNEFLNTPEFWLKQPEEGGERIYCRPLTRITAAYYAAAWALFSQCPILQMYLADPNPGRPSKQSVSDLLCDLQARVRELKIDAGIDPIEAEKQEDKQ